MRADALTRRRRTSRYTCGWARAAVWCAQTRPQPLQVSRRAPFHSLAHHSTRFFPSVPLPPPTEPYVCPHVRARSRMADNMCGDDAAAALADIEAKRAARLDKIPSMRRLLHRLSTTRFASQAVLADAIGYPPSSLSEFITGKLEARSMQHTFAPHSHASSQTNACESSVHASQRATRTYACQ